MIEAAARSLPVQSPPIAPAPLIAAAPLALNPLLQATAPAMPLLAANDGASTGGVHANALLADDVYRAEPAPPAGTRVATADDLKALGLTPQMLEMPGSSFRARVYATETVGGTDYTVAFRGSSAGEDWSNNARQALGLNSESYAKALQIGRQIARSDEQVSFTGHSLGGGLASAAAIASGRSADTFNAAGLHRDTIDAARGIAAANGRGAASVDAWFVPREVLHVVQNGGDRALGGVLGGIPGALLADAPEAYGTQRALPDIRPEGKSFFDGLNPVDRHGMDWVVAGTAGLR